MNAALEELLEPETGATTKELELLDDEEEELDETGE